MSNEEALEALRQINTKLGAIRSALLNPIQYKTAPVVEGLACRAYGISTAIWRRTPSREHPLSRRTEAARSVPTVCPPHVALAVRPPLRDAMRVPPCTY